MHLGARMGEAAAPRRGQDGCAPGCMKGGPANTSFSTLGNFEKKCYD